ncbi:deoxynucleotidyltransferase terminal-interacting protein 1 isoform X2 [Podarcis raffonei]|uniref:deoxynucleotidyltransferase terminal-interacting protein 1 isoform X2 n=1 Tax=Podarcis raffonei TaxID=65483 RepID=UPI00232949C5|nr:deoxynucleotidyltransferase terminal-interacting protein 1 isoform X2 [Podarcis raffonei]
MGAAREAEQQPAPEPERGEEEDEEDEEAAAGQEEAEEEEAGPGGSGAASPWNIMIKHRLVQRRGRRSQVMTSFTDPVVSMDLLRAVLQPSINEEIQAVFSKYMKFFQKAAGNVRENVGEDVDTEQLIQETCRSCLEQAKLLFCDSKKSAARLPHEVPAMKRAKPMEEEMSQQGSPIPRKVENQVLRTGAEGWSQVESLSDHRHHYLRPWIKGQQYAADAQDKHWLAEQQHMRATGGKMAYLLLEEDIQDLAMSDDYRSSMDLKMDELKPFTPPPWMTAKMRRFMETLRSEGEPPLPEGTQDT